MRPGRRRTVEIAVALVIATVVVPTPIATAASPLTWSKTLDVLPDEGAGFNAMSCASENLCVGGDSVGDLVASTNPTGGAGAWNVTTQASLGSSSIGDISCPTEELCVVTDGQGQAFTSTTPASGGWTLTELATCGPGCGDNLTGVSCASEQLCVVVGNRNFVSTDPTGGAVQWDELGGLDMQSISCPSDELCVGVNHAGTVTWSDNPSFGPETWSSAAVLSNSLDSISCPDQFFCLGASSSTGDVIWSTDPTGGAGAWHVVPAVDPAGIYRVSCPTDNLCVAGTDSNQGNVIVSTDPTGPASAWTTQHINGTNEMYPMSCPTVNLCVTGDTALEEGEGGNILYGALATETTDVLATIVEIKKAKPDGPAPVVEIMRDGEWKAVTVGEELRLHDKIRTQGNSRAAIEFVIGGRAGMHPESELRIASERSVGDEKTAKRITVTKGGIWMKCDKLKEPMEIQTNGGVMGIKG